MVDRLMGRSVRDLAEEVDAALGRLAQARGLEAQAQDALRLAQQDVKRASREVMDARDALFQEHPDLAPTGWPGPAGTTSATDQFQEVPVTENPSAWEAQPVEVDDDNDPRFTAGAGAAISTRDDDPLPPIVWGEHDD